VVSTPRDRRSPHLSIWKSSQWLEIASGVFNLRPSLPRYKTFWDVRVLLNFLRETKLESLTLRSLSRKLATMLMVFSAQRTSTIVSLKVDDVRMSENRCIIIVTELQKSSKPGRHISNLEFLRFDEEPELCTFTHIRKYIELTNSN
jgi:integrase